jgi:ATP-dependent protease ClpP protease subunit
MRDIMMNKRNPEMKDGEMDVLEQYAEMCRYQNKQRGKSEEDSLVNEEENENGENKSKTENAEKEKNLEKEDTQNEQIKEMGQVVLDSNSRKHKVELLTIIGEVEGHESAPSHSKTTKYEHVLPKLAIIEDDEEIEGLLILLNTVGGDVEAGLAIAEMIASLSIPTVSLVLGGGHSIGVPMAVSADYSFVVPSATMVIHPVRSSGMFIGVAQTYRNMEKIQDRITTFISEHSKASQQRLEELMLDTTQLVKDVGTMLEGKEAVKEGLIDEVGGIKEALAKLYELIEKNDYK